jgi:aldehyde dehydrogenase (NAD+)
MTMTIHPAFNPQIEVSEEVRTSQFIDGEWRAPRSDARLILTSPVTEEPFLELPSASDADVDDAVRAARHAFDYGPWPRLSPRERAQAVRRLATELRKFDYLLARAWTAEIGTPMNFTTFATEKSFESLEFMADMGDGFHWEEPRPLPPGMRKAYVRYEPVGVCALITPWNYPIGMACFKIGPSLVAGCTVVIKAPSEAPLESLIVAQAALAAGIPKGVINVVSGGREVGDYLIHRPDIDKVSFTGSTAVGKHIAAVCAERMARCSLELGGKSAAIVLEDADFDLVIRTLDRWSMTNCGQGCMLPTRIVVPQKFHDELVQRYAETVQAYRIGNPMDDATRLGPLSMERQLNRVLGYVHKGVEEGATLVTGGRRPEAFERGYFIEPTVFGNVTSKMTIAQEEIFGPVISFLPYADENEAVRIANDSVYGLSGAVFSRDEERALNVASRIRTGTTAINTYVVDPSLPFGGFKQSGIGREHGREALLGFTETKAVALAA